MIVYSSSALKTNYEDCRGLSFKVTVKWVECRPYIYLAKQSYSNSTDVHAAGNVHDIFLRHFLQTGINVSKSDIFTEGIR
jgi:hypothetical protein